MNRLNQRLAIVLVALLLLFGGGYFAYSMLFPGEQNVAEPGPTPPKEPVTKSDAAPPQPSSSGVRVVELVGLVERRSGEGEWSAVSKGDELPSTEAIRTSEDGQATVRLGEAADLKLRADSEVTLGGQAGTALVTLEHGAAEVRARGDVRMKFSKSDAEAQGSDGAFAARTSGDGHVSVASLEGTVELSAAGETVAISSGNVSTVAPEAAPSAPVALPSSFLLKVKRPPSRIRTKSTIVRGTAAPGTMVEIMGKSAHVGSDGKFAVKVPLKEGANRVEVIARDVTGRSKRTLVPVKVDSTAPRVQGDVDW